MKGIILAGGEGTRLRPITLEIPKPLITVKKKPLINYSIETFARGGVKDIKVLIKPADREDYQKWMKVYGDDFAAKGIHVEVVEEPEPMGTFGFVAHRMGNWIGNEDIFMTNSDDIKDVDLEAMHMFHKERGAHATIAITEVPNAEDYGVTILEHGARDGAHHGGAQDARGGTVQQFLEKQKNPPARTISIGMYVLSPDVFAYAEPLVAKGKKFIMIEKDIFPVIAGTGRLAGFIHNGVFYDCGTLEKWEKTIKEL